MFNRNRNLKDDSHVHIITQVINTVIKMEFMSFTCKGLSYIDKMHAFHK